MTLADSRARHSRAVLTRGWLLICSLTLLPCSLTNAGVVLITHPATQIETFDTPALAKLWLGKTKTIANLKPRIVDQIEGSASRNYFYSKITHRSPREVKAYWAKTIFVGNQLPPIMLANDAAVKQWVLQAPNRLGYIDEDLVDTSVKPLMRIK